VNDYILAALLLILVWAALPAMCKFSDEIDKIEADYDELLKKSVDKQEAKCEK